MYKVVPIGVQFTLIQLGHELEKLVDFLAQYPFQWLRLWRGFHLYWITLRLMLYVEVVFHLTLTLTLEHATQVSHKTSTEVKTTPQLITGGHSILPLPCADT